MMSSQNKSTIMECLANDPTLEMNEHDVEQLLEAELAKPADEIDSVLVNELLGAMNAPEPDPEQMRQAWRAAKASLPRQAKARVPRAMMRVGAVAAAVVMLLFVTLRDAEAFRWTLIEKLLKPVAQTFGIVISDPKIASEEDESALYSIEDAPSELIKYDSLEDIPETAHGYLIRPKWIPEGYELMSASRFSGPDSEIYSLDFTHEDAWFNFRVHIITVDSAIFSQEFERNLDIPIERQIGGHVVTFYTNTDDKSQYAFWIHENADYRVIGDLSLEEACQFIEAME